MEKIADYISELNFPFHIIAISESGIKDSESLDIKDSESLDFDIKGYNSKHIIRQEIKYGGVSLYIKQEEAVQ